MCLIPTMLIIYWPDVVIYRPRKVISWCTISIKLSCNHFFAFAFGLITEGTFKKYVHSRRGIIVLWQHFYCFKANRGSKVWRIQTNILFEYPLTSVLLKTMWWWETKKYTKETSTFIKLDLNKNIPEKNDITSV